MVFFYNSIIFQLLLNGYYIYRLYRSKPIPKWEKTTLYAVITLEALIYFTGLLFREQLDIPTYALIQKINAFWIIANLYFVFLLCLFDLLYLLNKKGVFRIKINRKLLLGVEVIITALCIFLLSKRIEMSRDNYAVPVVWEHSFQFDAADVHAPTTYKLLVVSDFHLGYIINRPALEKYVDAINSHHPDIIVIDGDLVDYFLQPLVEAEMDVVLNDLKAPLGVYFIPGNHEYKLDAEANFNWIRSAGITVLKDSIANIDDQLYLIGWDDYSNRENRVSLESLIAKVPDRNSCILFAHQPKDIEEAVEQHIPLTISGHTHNGQFFPANLFSLVYNNFYGLHKKAESHSYTTSGIGLSGFPAKIVSQSEIAIFHIEVQ